MARKRQHKADAKRSKTKFHNALRKYGDAFVWEVIEKVDIELLDVRENFWITKFDSIRNGYNSTTGGSYNKVFSKESRAKMSAWQKGKPKWSQAQKEDKSARMMGNKYSLGFRHSQETKEKRRAYMLEHAHNACAIYCYNNDKIYPSAAVAALDVGISRQSVLLVVKGIYPEIKGWKFAAKQAANKLLS